MKIRLLLPLLFCGLLSATSVDARLAAERAAAEEKAAAAAAAKAAAAAAKAAAPVAKPLPNA